MEAVELGGWLFGIYADMIDPYDARTVG